MIVADVNGEIVAVAANERTEHPQQGSLADVRYLMVFAVRHDQRRGRHAKVLAESVIAEMQREGGPPTCPLACLPDQPCIDRLQPHRLPRGRRNIPSEDKPYASFMLSL